MLLRKRPIQKKRKQTYSSILASLTSGKIAAGVKVTLIKESKLREPIIAL